MNQSWEQVQNNDYAHSIQRKVPGYRLLHDTTAIIAEQLFPAEGRILIIGAGGGEDICTLSELMPHTRLVGIDSSARMLEIASQRVKTKSIELIKAKIHELAVHEEFDGAICLLMFHFIPNEEKQLFLQELYLRLQPGAQVLLGALADEEEESAFRLHFKSWEQYMLRNGGSMKEVNQFKASIGQTTFLMKETSFQLLLKNTGFSTAQRYYQSFFTRAWIFEKRGERVAAEE
ncbi:class I SAM-dependent methyltransferase [Terribacillus saccharophilus]|uniref:class I SAM-dependent methyltransferase n=1 Tax=Terribacillus saccharophilus TaxID=361277 RepID=UPI003D2B077D